MFFYIEVTDTFSGEANYSWVTRHVIKAESMKGAVNKFSRMTGGTWRCTENYGECKRYDSRSGATCFFIEEFEDRIHGEFKFATDDRN